MFSIFICYFK